MSRARAIRWFFAFCASASLLAGTAANADGLCDTTDRIPTIGALTRTLSTAVDDATSVDLCRIAPDPGIFIEPSVDLTPKVLEPTPIDPPPPSSSPRARPAAATGTTPDEPTLRTPSAPAGADAPATNDDITAPPPVPVASIAPIGVALGIALVAFLATWLGMVAGRRRGRRAGLAEAGELLDALEDGIVVCDARGTVLAVNATAARLTGVRPEDARGRALRELLDARDEHGRDVATRATAAETPQQLEVTIGGEDGIPARVAIAPVRDGGSVIGHALVMRDLREQRHLARMKTEILANVGHELRTPLTSALGFARLVQTRDLSPDKAQAFLGAIVDACEKLERVIDLLIGVATVESGDAPGETDRINLERLVRARVRAWEARSPRHAFRVEAARGIGQIVGNRALLEHAVEELLDNAVKFSPDAGQITIAVQPRGDEIEISVTDAGIGIAPEHLDALFEDFAQGDGSPTRRFGGLGLGLALVRRVARTHGGSVSVSSEPGAGSTFRLRLPMVRLPGRSAPQPRTAAYARASAGT